MSLNYATYVTALQQLGAYAPNDGVFISYIPNIIDYAEQRIYRELQLLDTVVRDTSATCTANSRNFTLPQTGGRFVAVAQINVVTPVSATVANGTRNTVVGVSLPVIDFTWPSNTAPSATTVPSTFAMITDQTVAFGPAPGDAFQVEVVGTIRPTPLSRDNATTYLSLYLPDLFLAASMIALTGYQKNFGAQSDTPAQAGSWEHQYQTLMQSANTEETRKKFTGTIR